MSQKKTAATSQFSIRQLVSAYNTYYRSGGAYARTTAKTKYPKLSFRVYEKENTKDSKKNQLRESRKFVVRLSEFTAVADFKKAYDSGVDNKMNHRTEKDKAGNEKSSAMSNCDYLKFLIENYVYDIHLRSCLNIASSGFRLHPKSKSKKEQGDEEEMDPPDIFCDYLVPQLGFTQRKSIEPKDYIEALRAYFKSDALRIKGYNKVFPHSIRNADKKHKGINYVFLQRLSSNYDEILKAIIAEGKSDAQIIAMCQDTLSKKPSNKQYKKQIMSRKISEAVLTGPPTITRTKKNGEEVEETDAKWISKLKDENDKTGTKTIAEDAQKVISGVVKELMSVKAFIAVVRSSIEAAENPSDIDKAYHEFTEMCESLNRFNARHENIENTFEAFVKYVLDAHFLLKDTFDIKAPLKLIASSIKTKVDFKFTRSLKENFDKLIAAYDNRESGSDKEKRQNEEFINTTIAIAAKYCEDNTKSISVVKGYDFLDNSLEIYSNVGRYANVALPKTYRIAMGIAIVKWINEKIDLYVAENKKREVLIIDLKE